MNPKRLGRAHTLVVQAWWTKPHAKTTLQEHKMPGSRASTVGCSEIEQFPAASSITDAREGTASGFEGTLGLHMTCAANIDGESWGESSNWTKSVSHQPWPRKRKEGGWQL
jgi:hypothetical protein